MRVDEILSSTKIAISPAKSSYGLMNLVQAYEFEIDSNLFVCYLDSCAGPGKPNTLGFMKVVDHDTSHRVTGDNIPFRVLSTVMQCVRKFIEDVHPLSIYINGFSSKQHHLYLKMVKHFRNLIPSPYFVALSSDGKIYISRDENLGDDERIMFTRL